MRSWTTPAKWPLAAAPLPGRRLGPAGRSRQLAAAILRWAGSDQKASRPCCKCVANLAPESTPGLNDRVLGQTQEALFVQRKGNLLHDEALVLESSAATSSVTPARCVCRNLCRRLPGHSQEQRRILTRSGPLLHLRIKVLQNDPVMTLPACQRRSSAKPRDTCGTRTGSMADAFRRSAKRLRSGCSRRGRSHPGARQVARLHRALLGPSSARSVEIPLISARNVGPAHEAAL